MLFTELKKERGIILFCTANCIGLAGAMAARQAVNAVLHKQTLKEYAKTHEELAEALKYWKVA